MEHHKTQRHCIYCGNPVGRVKKGEHIIPEAIGGALTIKTVCNICNNQFSLIDTELCSRSCLSIVASQEIDSHIWQVWDIDPTARNLLIEGRPDWSTNSLVAYPQMVFESTGPQIRGDYEQMLYFGRENYEHLFVKAMLHAFRRYESGEKKWLHFERIMLPSTLEFGCRLPPRLFWRHSINELADRVKDSRRTSFVMRYLSGPERRFALNQLDNWNFRQGFKRYSVSMGSRLPSFRCLYDINKVFRALAKIAFNTLAKFCPHTPINKSGFQSVTSVITGKSAVTPKLICKCGFVRLSDIQPIADNKGGHSFRILYIDGNWKVFTSFFGGRIGSYFSFPGRNNEQWCSADIVAPLRSRKWTFSPSRILQPLNARVEWRDLTKIISSDQLCNMKTELRRVCLHAPMVGAAGM